MFFIRLIVNLFIIWRIANAIECNETMDVTGSGVRITRTSPGIKPGTPCFITLKTDMDHKFKVDITINEDEKIQNDKDCKDDFVSVGNSAEQQSEKICHKGQTLHLESTGNMAVIKYQFKKRDPKMQAKWSFIANIERVNAMGCNETVDVTGTGTRITRTSPGVKPGTTCFITLKTDSDYKLKMDINIDEGEKIQNDKDCKDDFVSVGNSAEQQSEKICHKGQTLHLDSIGNMAVIAYRFKEAASDPKMQAKWSFIANIERVDPKAPCGSFPTKFDGSPLVFEFPMNMTVVEMPVTCDYTIEHTGGRHITASVDKVNMYVTPTCDNDYLALSSNPALTEGLKVCKMPENPLVYTTLGSKLFVQIKVTNYMVNPSVRFTLQSGSMRRGTTFITVTLLSLLWLKPLF